MKILIRFIIWTSLLLIPFKGAPCGFSLHGEDIRVYLFSPTAAEAQDYSPFFYTSRFLNDENHDWWVIPNENLDEWFKYFKEEVDKESIRDLVYNTSYEELHSLSESLIYNGSKLCENKLAQYIQNQDLKDLAAYLAFTKKTETLIYEDDPWESVELDEEKVKSHILEGKKKVTSSKDGMLKQRYAYHVIVMLRYMGLYKEAVSFFENEYPNVNKKNESIIKYWTLSHLAHCQKQIGLDEAAYLNYARVFMNCHAKKNWVYKNMSRKSVLSVLDQAENDSDKYAIYTFSEFKNPARSYEGLKKIAAINPNTEIFKTLMIREINKIEDWVLTRRYTRYDPSIVHWSWNETNVSDNYDSDFKYLEKIIGFTENLLLDNKLENRGVYELMLAHLYFVHESPDMSLTYLRRAEKSVKGSYENNQLHLTRILNHLLYVDEIDVRFENEIWKDLEALSKDEKYMNNHNKNLSNLMLALQQTYHKKGMYDRAALFIAWGQGRDWGETDFRYWEYMDPFFYLDKYASVEQVKSFQEIYIKKNKTNLESFLLNKYDYSKDRYWDLIGTKYLRKDQLEKALQAYDNVPAGFWLKEFYYHEYLGTDLFMSEYDPVFSSTDENINIYFINKSYLIQQLIDKKKQYQKSKKNGKAQLAFDLGNAYYNLSYYGSHWHCMAYIQTASEYSYFGEYDDSINENYRTCNTALKYFAEAFDLTKDSEYMSEEENLMRKIVYAIANIQTIDANKSISKHWKKSLAEVETKHPEFYQMMLEECASLSYD